MKNLSDYPLSGTVEQAAEALSCSPWSVRKLISSGELRHVRIGRAIRVPRSSIADYLCEKNETPAVTGAPIGSDLTVSEGNRNGNLPNRNG